MPASGSDAPAQWTTSTLTTTETGSSTISTTDHATESYTLGGAVATQWLSSTDTLTGTNGDTGTLTSTENLTGVTSFGSGLSITGGNQSDSLYQTGSDFPSQVSTDTITSTDSLVYAYANSDPTIARTMLQPSPTSKPSSRARVRPSLARTRPRSPSALPGWLPAAASPRP